MYNHVSIFQVFFFLFRCYTRQNKSINLECATRNENIVLQLSLMAILVQLQSSSDSRNEPGSFTAPIFGQHQFEFVFRSHLGDVSLHRRFQTRMEFEKRTVDSNGRLRSVHSLQQGRRTFLIESDGKN